MNAGNWLLFFVVLGVILWTYRYSQVRGQVVRGRWMLLVGLRLAGVVLIVWLLSGPTRQERIEEEEHVYFPILIDDSRSMGLAGASGATRAEEATALVFGPGGLAGSLSERGWQAPVLRMSDLAPLTPDEPFTPETPDTRIGQALERAAEVWKPEELAGLILISDGRDHGENPARAAQRLERPLLSIGLGPEQLPLDLAVEHFSAPRRVYAEETFTVTLRALRQGAVREVVDATLSIAPQNDEATPTVQPMQLEFEAGQSVLERDLELRLSTPGGYRLTLELDAQPGEEITDNNQAVRDVQVEKARLRVLLAAQRLDWEVGFMRRHLGGDPRIELAMLMPVSSLAPSIDPAAPPPAQPGETLLFFHEEEIESPTHQRRTLELAQILEELGHYDVFLLYRPGSMITPELAERISQQVEKGATLVVLGWDRGDPTGARQLGRLLPAGFANQPPIPYEQTILPSTQIADLPVGEMLASVPWHELPPMTDTFALERAQPAARVLLWGQTQGLPSQPLLLMQRFGLGRVLQSALANSWRWQMYTDMEERTGPGALETFWLSLLHYTAQDPGGFESRLELPRSVVRRGETVEIRLFRDVGRAESRPPDTVQLRVVAPSGGQESLSAALLRRNLGLYEAGYTPSERGAYLVVFEEAEQRVERGFSVVEDGHEEADYTMDRALLERLAEASGGLFALPHDAPAALARFRFEPRTSTAVVPVFIGRSPWVLLALLALFCLEWLLRRVAQLS